MTKADILENIAQLPVCAFEHALEGAEDFAEEAGIVIDNAMRLEALELAIAKLQEYARSIQL